MRLPLVTLIVLGGFVFATKPAFGQIVPLSQVEIRLERMPAGGCIRCDPSSLGAYEVKITGDGTVEYRDFENPDVMQVRIISADDVLALANEFIAAGFLDAHDGYDATRCALIREGDGVIVACSGSSSEVNRVILTLRIGQRIKKVTLIAKAPPAIGKLPALVDQVGGPQAWPAR